jgi:hypothetical protein
MLGAIKRTALVLLLAHPAYGLASPEPRWGHVFVHDEARDEILLFGGASSRHQYRDDTWTWRAGTWKRHAVEAPPARGFAAAAFDPTRKAVVVHGGRAGDGSTLSDTWEWNGTAWRRLAESGPWKADHHGLVYDAERRMLVGFGGWDGATVQGLTWTFDGEWRTLSRGGPPPRAAFGMAYDAGRKRVVVYGGLWIHGQYADTFEWDGRTWSAVTGPYENSSLDHHAMAHDTSSDRLVLFGGKDYRGELSGQTRALVGSQWSSVAKDGPSPRHSTTLACQRSRNAILLFGGKEQRGEDQLPLGDLWEWDGRLWRQR